ncbi:MAG: NAD(P)/FAD-dependent oxidoreductase [Planctomycetota bacterium]
MNREPYVIIGNSVAAMGAVAGIRSVDAERRITVISRESHHTYSRPLISYLLGGKVDEEGMLYRAADFYDRNNIRPTLGVEASCVNPEAKTVETDDGCTLCFDKLLIATGGDPIVPPDVEGVEADGVFTFTTWDDAREIEAYVEGHGVEKAVIVGGGLIGLKSMEALVERGIETTVVELADRILGATFDQTASELARRQLERAGVTVLCKTTVSRIEAAEGEVSGAVLRDGTRLPCGLVIFAIGVRPNVAIVRGTSVEVDRGVVVDDGMRTSAEDVYAAGDVAQARLLLREGKRPIPIFPNAYRQGLIAGVNMAGGDATWKGGVAMNSVEVLGLPTISVGITSPEGEGYDILSELGEDALRYKKIVLRDDRVVGAIFIGDIDRAGIITGLIREQIDVSGFKDLLLTEEFGLISLPREYRKHVVSGMGIVV